ncbi:MAG: DUF896 domain-containing protein [Bacteroidales bacterium]|nr:DUF896 domain-containing protein [Bacteroidales bacterium]
MKKILYLLLLLGVAFSQPVQAQGFLKKMKQKAENAMNKVVGVDQDATADKAGEQTQPAKTPTVTDRIPKLRRTTVSWDGVVKPSTAANARALMSELPSLPSVSQIVNPTPEARETYYNRLVSIEMRIEELDDQQGCDDEELKVMRDKLYNELSGKLGLTPDEMKKLEDSNLSEAERARLEKKIQDAMLGGANPDDISAKAEKNEARLEQIEKRINELEKKEKKGTLTAADKQERESLQQEMIAMSQEMMQGMSGMMDMANSIGNVTAGINAEVAQLEQKLSAFADKVMAQRKGEPGVVKSCEQIASEYESQLQSIYDQIWAESDQDKVDALYDQADAIMKNYRTRAAKIYLNGLQLRLDNTKKLLSEAETLYADMASAQMIPKCVVGRMPLNIVTQCVDILNEAYTDFPQPTVLPVHRETFFKLEKGESLLWSESGFSGNLDDFTNNSILLIAKSNGIVNEYYKLENGTRVKLSSDGPFDFSVKKDGRNSEATQYGEWTSRSGKRKVVYTRDGSLTLHDGTTLYPMAVKASSDKIEFIIYDYSNDEFTKCTYKL